MHWHPHFVTFRYHSENLLTDLHSCLQSKASASSGPRSPYVPPWMAHSHDSKVTSTSDTKKTPPPSTRQMRSNASPTQISWNRIATPIQGIKLGPPGIFFIGFVLH